MAIEHELVTCETCGSRGMHDGLRCRDCNGQGFVRRSTIERPVDPEQPENLADVPFAELRRRAKEADLDAKGTKEQLIERLTAAAAATEESAAEA